MGSRLSVVKEDTSEGMNGSNESIVGGDVLLVERRRVRLADLSCQRALLQAHHARSTALMPSPRDSGDRPQ
jgi:hypothetical protein